MTFPPNQSITFFSPFHVVVIERERAGKIFQKGYIVELLSFSMDVKTDFV
jgi:hypothetical protein